MIFKTTKGDILFEKNARINASTTMPKSEDWYDLNDVPHLTLNDLFKILKSSWDPSSFLIIQIQIIVKILYPGFYKRMASEIKTFITLLNKTLQ